MAYLFHDGEFIKGKIVNNIIRDDGDGFQTHGSKFVSEDGDTVLYSSRETFQFPTGKTVKSCCENTIKYYNDKIDRKFEDLQFLIKNFEKRKLEVAEAYLRERLSDEL